VNEAEKLGRSYRPDIDGLRAIAVLWVIAFHAFPTIATGGFTGVDVFFVISGFLISGIILGNLERGRFSFAGFYARRIRRIFPALLVVLVASYAFGWCALLAGEFKQLGEHVAGGAAFVANFVLWHESGYFDNAAATKPLLHLWSLGIEEQFYVFWPLILWLGWKRRISSLATIVGIAILSFAANVYQSGTDPVAAFYSPLTRFWELMLGSILAYATLHEPHRLIAFKGRLVGALAPPGSLAAEAIEQRLHTCASVAGAMLIFAGMYFIPAGDRFPGWWAALPTLGALLVIAAGPRAWVNRIVLSNRVLVGVGLISYPLYLWHWPMLSFVRILEDHPSYATRSVVVLVALVLAWLTYEIVEKPIRFGTKSALRVPALLVSMLLIGGIGLDTARHDGLKSRAVVAENVSFDSGLDGGRPKYALPCNFLPRAEQDLFYCAIDSRGAPRYALLGDSKAGALFPGVFRTAPPERPWLFIGSGNSGPVIPVLSHDPIYDQYKKKPIETAIGLIGNWHSIRTVVIVTAARALFQLPVDDSLEGLPASKNYAAALGGMDRAVTKLIAYGKNIVLLVDNPTLPHKKDCINRKTSSALVNAVLVRPSSADCHLPIRKYLLLSKQYRQLLYEIKKRHPGRVEIFDATDILCSTLGGICSPTKNRRLLYFMTDHVSQYGATLVGTALNRFLDATP
jgi:peptidoglycan/LPS O-acetylase OafA/YrhL